MSVHTEHRIGAEWVDSDRSFTVRSPIDESVLAEVSAGTAAEIDHAVAAAAAAFPAWAGLGAPGRQAHLDAFANLVAERAEDFATVESLDTGMLRRFLPPLVRTRVHDNLAYFGQLAVEQTAHSWDTESDTNNVRYDPAGVAAIITPWNGPLSITTYKLGAALAAGDTVVVKPPEWAPLSCALLAEVAEAAGLPPGVLNVVHGLGEVAGAALSAHPGIARIAFTGSPEAARSISVAAAPNLVPVSFELGGKSPLLVFADADLDAAASAIAAQYFHSTQICAAGTRVLVDASVASQLLEKVRERVATLRQGDPRDPETDVGPLISRPHFERVSGFVDRARAEGAEVLWGGGAGQAGGLYYAPTMLTGVRPDMEVWRSEVFGPVLVWDTFAGDEEAIEKANDTPYGLAAHVWTSSEDRAVRAEERLVAGTVWVNVANLARHMATPFGGAKDSGIGREGGMWSLEFFSEVKNVCRHRGTLG